MTIRLYEEDSELLDFTATVISCERKGDVYLAELDRTAFFPEGGGQGADHGTLGTAEVTDCHDHHGTILHTLSAPLACGETVEGHVDGRRRLSMMQQHSGEHIFSGLVHQHFGYNNVGFHIGSDAVTMDFDGKMTLEDALRIEAVKRRLASAAIQTFWVSMRLLGFDQSEALQMLSESGKQEREE